MLERYNKFTIELDYSFRVFNQSEPPIERFKLDNALNFLIARKEDIELFGDSEGQKESNELKKHFELEGGIPGVLKGRWGVEEK